MWLRHKKVGCVFPAACRAGLTLRRQEDCLSIDKVQVYSKYSPGARFPNVKFATSRGDCKRKTLVILSIAENVRATQKAQAYHQVSTAPSLITVYTVADGASMIFGKESAECASAAWRLRKGRLFLDLGLISLKSQLGAANIDNMK